MGSVKTVGTEYDLIPVVCHIMGEVVNAIALGWLGMWFGYRARNTWSALVWPVGLVTGFDWVLGIVSVKWAFMLRAFMLPGFYPLVRFGPPASCSFISSSSPSSSG